MESVNTLVPVRQIALDDPNPRCPHSSTISSEREKQRDMYEPVSPDTSARQRFIRRDDGISLICLGKAETIAWAETLGRPGGDSDRLPRE